MTVRFLTENVLTDMAAEREVILFGAGYYAEKTLNMMTTHPCFLVDNNIKKQGTEFGGLIVPYRYP